MNIVVIPAELIIGSILKNLIKGGVICENDKELSRKALLNMDVLELIDTLARSQKIVDIIASQKAKLN